VVRRYEGEQAYVVEKIGIADDFGNADGIAILNFKQAQDAARDRMVQRAAARLAVAEVQALFDFSVIWFTASR
jgi:hypothetical protein